jgi:hypothetical protein
MADGIILWKGISELDGITPIVVIATGLRKASKNSKTGGMVQVQILREDLAPHHGVKLGLDFAICGDCPHREGSCYVLTFQGPLSTFKAFERGAYPMAQGHELEGLRIRVGTYGDPTAVPLDVWLRILRGTAGWTGYTHQWRKCDPGFKYILMASADDPEDYREAKAAGWRVFRTRLPTEPVLAGEIVCPSAKEGGRKAVCADCLLCDGTTGEDNRRDIAIVAHGPAPKVQAYERMRLGHKRLEVLQ